MPRLSKIGAAALAAFGWTGASSVTASYLVVAGGGSGGSFIGGGGGAGGMLTGSALLNSTLSYTVTVGAGGSPDSQGSNSVFNAVTSTGGGKGGVYDAGTGGAGGSGGGGAGTSGTTSSSSGGSGTSGQGNAGGNTSGATSGGSGGGGKTNAGGSASNGNGANGGDGAYSSISGSAIVYAGGGGGGARTLDTGTGGTGGAGGGGRGGGPSGTGQATSGTANLGGGGGGYGFLSSGGSAGSGGSGVVIISYPAPQKFGGGIVTTSGSNVIHTFTTSGILSPLSSLTASYLIVAGGGGGGGAVANASGGGGAGGLIFGSGTTIDTNSNYVVTVGSGGSSGAAGANGGTGGASSFSIISNIANGGGYGAGGGGGAGQSVTNASGGGGSAPNSGGGTGGTGTVYGNNGGAGSSGSGSSGAGGGGGGSGTAGSSASGGTAGSGGAGTSSTISGVSVTYAAGGAGAGGSSGAGASGASNTGNGGVGGAPSSNAGGAGGSGIVIISYAGSVQQMAGGTVTISGGNVIHTFTSSGYLTPLKFVGNSLRFRSSASAYLNRTLGTATNNKIWTWSAWVKRGTLALDECLFSGGTTAGDANNSNIRFSSSDVITFSSDATNWFITNQVFRDPAAWYHFTLAVDTTQATAANRVLFYVNGVKVTSFSASTAPTQNTTIGINTASAHYLANRAYPSNLFFDGEITEINFIDGQQLTPNSFGTFNSYGVWQPITYGGSYGTNGFYLPFSNKTSTTTLGYDFSPAGNNWTTNNISLTAGSTYDSMTDVPTLTSTTAANYCTWNPLNVSGYSATSTLTNGNLTTSQSSTYVLSTGTIGVSSGKWYWEVTGFSGSYPQVGVTNAATPQQSFDTANTWMYTGSNGNKVNNNSSVAYGATFGSSDVIGVALDMNAGTLTFYKNNTSQGVAYTTGLLGLTLCPSFASGYLTAGCSVNFGQQPFSYTPPSGFVALNTYNL